MNEALVTLVRSLIAFFTLLIFARLLGKQQISQLTFFDYVLGITIGSIAASLSVDLSSRAWPHWVALLIWSGTVLVLQLMSHRSVTANKYLVGEPALVIINGQVMEEAMKRLRYTTADLLEQLRSKNVFDLSQVAFAVLETNGELSVLFKPEYQPLTPKDLNMPGQASALNTQLIFNGHIMEENLRQLNLDHTWLSRQLGLQGIDDASQVYLASYNPATSSLYVDRFQDQI